MSGERYVVGERGPENLIAAVSEGAGRAVLEAEAKWEAIGADVVGLYVVVPMARELYEQMSEEHRSDLSRRVSEATTTVVADWPRHLAEEATT